MQGEVAGVGIRFLKTSVSCVIAGEMWHSSSVGCAAGNVKEVWFDSCSSSSLIPLQVLGVMVCKQCLMISALQGWLMVGIQKTVFNPFIFKIVNTLIWFKEIGLKGFFFFFTTYSTYK